MTDEILIRPFEMRDRAAVQDFFDSMGQESAAFFNVNHGNENRCMSFFDGSARDTLFFTADYNGKCVGLMFIWDLKKSVPWFGIAVRDDMQRRGIGSGLIEYIKNFLFAKGSGGLLLRTAVTNTKAQGLYEKCGFEKIGVHPSGELLYIFRSEVKAVESEC